MSSDRYRQSLMAFLGITAGVAAGVWLWSRRPRPRDVQDGWRHPIGSAELVANALRGDPNLSGRAVDVEAIADGVIELTGSVRTHSEAARAVDLAQGTTGVYTVVNRLTVAEEEAHRQETRRRREDGAPELRERQHYGMGVGMGARRQSAATDPDRPSDKQRILDRELEVDRVAEGGNGAAAPEVDEAVAGQDAEPEPGPGAERA